MEDPLKLLFVVSIIFCLFLIFFERNFHNTYLRLSVRARVALWDIAAFGCLGPVTVYLLFGKL